MQNLIKVDIYTDGACSGNPGPGSWAALLKVGNHIKEISGFEPNTTNNRMELTAAIEALKALNKPCRIDLYSDSAYLVKAFNEKWIDKWQRNNWRNAAKQEVSNKELWQELLTLTATHDVNWIWVKGHADNEYNNRVDQLAVEQIKKNR